MRVKKHSLKFSYKLGFYTLLILILVFLCTGIYYIQKASQFINHNSTTLVVKNKRNFNSIQANFELDRASFNELLSKIVNSQGNAPYRLILSDKMHIIGQIHWLTLDFPYDITSDVKADSNGNLLLEITSIQLGRIYLPRSIVLGLISQQNEDITWLDILPEQESMIIRFDLLTQQLPFKLRMKDYNEVEGKFKFTADLSKDWTLTKFSDMLGG